MVSTKRVAAALLALLLGLFSAIWSIAAIQSADSQSRAVASLLGLLAGTTTVGLLAYSVLARPLNSRFWFNLVFALGALVLVLVAIPAFASMM